MTSGGAATLQGVYGSLLLASDGAYTYTLDHTRASTQGLVDGQLVTETFTYTITDGPGSSTPERTTSLTINVQGTAPTAVADIENTTLVEDTVSVASGNVLADDTPVGAANVVLSGTNVFGFFRGCDVGRTSDTSRACTVPCCSRGTAPTLTRWITRGHPRRGWPMASS